MLVETAKKYWDKEKYDLNCAECIIYAANEEYDLNLSKETLKTLAAFGGGMGSGCTCGALAGAAAVIGVMFTEVSGHKSPQVRAMIQEVIRRFKNELGYTECRDIKGKIDNKNERMCTHMIKVTSTILEDVINKR